MGQQRTDSNAQIAAKHRVAEKRRCHHCNRMAAMSSPYEIHDDYGYVGFGRTCLYCGARRGVVNHVPFKMTPEENEDVHSR